MRTEQEISRAMEQYADMVRRICLVHLKSYHDTEDIFQTVFFKYMMYSGSFDSEAHEKAWFVRVTVNACRDLLRSLRHRTAEPLEILDTLPAEATVSESSREVLEAVLALPPKYKDVIYLFFYEGYQATEIARILKKRVNTIYTLLSRGKALLRQSLGGEEFE